MEHAAFEKIVLAPASCFGDLGAAAGPTLVFAQSLEHADRRVERGARGAVLGLAVPAAVRQLLAEQPVDEMANVLTEIGPARRHLAVDARLDLTFEESVGVA